MSQTSSNPMPERDASSDEPEQTLHDRYESSELTDEQSAELRAGRLPGELKLEAIQTIGVIIALVMALVAVILSMTAMSKASDAQDVARESVSMSRTLDDRVADKYTSDEAAKIFDNAMSDQAKRGDDKGETSKQPGVVEKSESSENGR